MIRQLLRLSLLIVACLSFIPTVAQGQGQGQGQGYDALRGPWQVVEMVDNGRVISREAIPNWLPSGGHLEIMDNTLVFTSNKDGQRHSRTFVIDATTYPKLFNVMANNQVYGEGIYELTGNRLVICVSPAGSAPRPTDFSAPEGSRRALMVMERVGTSVNGPVQSAPPTSTTVVSQAARLPVPPVSAPVTTAAVPVAPIAVPVPPVTAGIPLTDAEVRRLLPGNWRTVDAYGALIMTMNADGTYASFRETANTSTFQQVFARVPVSSGNWMLNNGAVVFNCTSSTQPERLHKNLPFSVRSITQTELTFVDYAGNVGKAVRVP